MSEAGLQFFVVIARDRPESFGLRARTKASHMAHLDRAAPGLRVLQSGPLLDSEGRESGSLLVLEAETADAVAAFVEQDPYGVAGLFASTEIRPWLWRRGNPYLLPVDPSGTR